MTLLDVAKGAGLSAGFISQVERGLASPSLSSLHMITKTLGTDISSCLQQPHNPTPLTRKDDREVYFVQTNNLRYERLSTVFAGNILNSVIIHEPPGHRSEPIRHEGEELFFVLDGELTVEIDDQQTVLHVGDSIHFQSSRKHSTWNHSKKDATVLHVCTMDVFGDTKYAAGPIPRRNQLHLNGNKSDAQSNKEQL